MPSVIENAFDVRTEFLMLRTFFEAASQDFATGDVVALSSQLVAESKAENTTFASGLLGNIKVLGHAQHPASGTTGNRVICYIPNPLTEFAFPIAHSTHGSSTLAYTQMGEDYDLVHLDASTTNYTQAGQKPYCVAISATSNTKVVVTGFVARPDYDVPGYGNVAYDATGEKFGHVWARYLESVLQLSVGA